MRTVLGHEGLGDESYQETGFSRAGPREGGAQSVLGRHARLSSLPQHSGQGTEVVA